MTGRAPRGFPVFLAAACAVLLGVPGRRAEAQRPCASAALPRRSANSAVLSLEAAAVGKRDTLAQVRICLALPQGKRVGSFHLEIDYDSTRARALRASPASGGAQVANTLIAGQVSIAGAAPAGFGRGVLSTITFRRRAGTVGPMRLTLRELNGTDGGSIAATARAIGIGTWTVPAPTVNAADAPVLEKVEPSTAEIVPGGVAEVIIRGQGFTPTGNVVMLGSAVLGELRSTDGTTLRLLVPNAWPSSGEAPPRVIETGDYSLQIRNTRGVSNTILLTLVHP